MLVSYRNSATGPPGGLGGPPSAGFGLFRGGGGTHPVPNALKTIATRQKTTIFFIAVFRWYSNKDAGMARLPQSSLKVEIPPGIIVTDVADHFPDPFDIVRQLSIRQFLSEQVAKDTPEIFVAGEGQKTSRVR